MKTLLNSRIDRTFHFLTCGFFHSMIEHYKNLDLADIKYIDEFGENCIEQWIDIKDHEGNYRISDLCRVKSLYREVVFPSGRVLVIKERILKLSFHRQGYLYVGLSKNGKQNANYAHRLIATAFIPNPDKKQFVNHKNGIKWDNRKVNLEWSTKSENTQHAFDTGLIKPMAGEKHVMVKLTEKEVLEIRELKGFKSERKIAKEFNVSQATVSQILNRKAWTHI